MRVLPPILDRRPRPWWHYAIAISICGLACHDVASIMWPSRQFAAQTMTLAEAAAIADDEAMDVKTRRAAKAVAYLIAKRAIIALAHDNDEHARILLRKLIEQLRHSLGD